MSFGFPMSSGSPVSFGSPVVFGSPVFCGCPVFHAARVLCRDKYNCLSQNAYGHVCACVCVLHAMCTHAHMPAHAYMFVRVCVYARVCVCTFIAQRSACVRVSVALVSLKPCTDRCSWLHAAMSWELQKDKVRVLRDETRLLTDDPDG